MRDGQNLLSAYYFNADISFFGAVYIFVPSLFVSSEKCHQIRLDSSLITDVNKRHFPSPRREEYEIRALLFPEKY